VGGENSTIILLVVGRFIKTDWAVGLILLRQFMHSYDPAGYVLSAGLLIKYYEQAQQKIYDIITVNLATSQARST
jgi:hypothetical protein